MKKLFFIFTLFLSAFSFISVMPPGWYQQTLPVNKSITDIYFADTLNGWAVTTWSPQFDTAYILRTTNGGDNWIIQNKGNYSFTAIQFLNNSTGYAIGGDGRAMIFKTTNSGTNWSQAIPFGSGVNSFQDIHFVNIDTGWISSTDGIGGGVWKTTNGGINWIQQLNQTYSPLKIHFINKDTGWMGTSEANGRLFRTTNGGSNWNLIYTSNFPVESLFFINSQKGWIRGGTGNGVMYSTNGGFNWQSSQGTIATGFDIEFINDSIGYSGTYSSFKVMKSTDGGVTWGYQTTPQFSGNVIAVLKNDTSHIWAGRLMHTTDGGGAIIYTSVEQISSQIPTTFKLHQNYPNPFNPSTIINYELKITGNVKLIIYDINGKVIHEAVNKKQSAGSYQYTFDGTRLTSGVYFYTLQTDNFSDTKKMLLVK